MSDYLTDEEQVERLKNLWRDWGITIVVALLLGIGGTVGWDYYKIYQANRAQSAADLYVNFMEASALGEPVAQIEQELGTKHGDSAYYAFVLLREAKTAVDAGNSFDAHANLTKAFDVAAGTSIGDLVALRKAKVEFELGQMEAVLATLQHIETAGYRWQALMLKGDVHFQDDELDAARDAYQAAKDQLPKGIESDAIGMRLASVPPVP